MKKILLKLSGLRLLGSLFGLVYSILQVRFFGASAEMDAFFVAMTAVYTITSLIQGGQLSEIFLPEYLSQKKNYGSKAAHNLLSAILNRMVIFVGILVTGIFFAAPVIIDVMGPGLSPEFKELAIHLFSLSLILVFFTLISSFVNTTLNAEQIFGRPEITGLINGAVSIILLIAFHKQFGVFTLVYSLLAGRIIEFFIGMVFLNRIGYKYSSVWKLEQYNISHFFQVMFTTSGYVGATQIYSITTTAMASFLPAGSLSIFNYVKQLSSKASSIIMGPVSTVFFSKFSAIVSEGRKNLEVYLKQPLLYLLILSLTIFCFILFSGEELLRVFWSKKSLSSSEFDIAYLFLSLNFFGFIFNSTGAVFRKTAVALGQAQILYKKWIIVQLFSAAYAFISIYFYGIYGLATILVINTTLMAGVSFFTSQRGGINSKAIAIKLLSDQKIWFFMASLLSSVAVMFSLFSFFDLANLLRLVSKISMFTIVILLLLVLFYGSDIRKIWTKI